MMRGRTSATEERDIAYLQAKWGRTVVSLARTVTAGRTKGRSIRLHVG